MSRLIPLLIFLVTAMGLRAQPDTLYVPSGDTTYAFPLVHGPLLDAEAFVRTSHFAFDTTRVAATLSYRRGKPSGVYRAYYPDGRPLIFAVYGWGSLHGDWTEYDEQGRVALKGQYRMGVREGTWAFRSQGIVGEYKGGVPHGKWRYYEDGSLARVEKWHKGKLLQGSTYRFLGIKTPIR